MTLRKNVDGNVTGCGVLVVDEEQKKILLLQRGETAPTCPGQWGGPGGLLEEDETEAEAATREVAEEAGVEITLESDVPFFSGTWKGDGREVRYFLALLREEEAGEISFPDREAVAYTWATYEEAMKLPLAFCYEEALQKLREEGHL